MNTNHSGELAAPAPAPSPELDRLMQSLGYVLFHWSLLERAFLDDIRRLRVSDGDNGETSIRQRGSFSERLAEWRALMSLKSRRNAEAAREVGDLSTLAERLRRQRNLIGQHFAGAMTKSEEGEPAILIAEGGLSSARSSQQLMTEATLDELVSEMDDCRRRIAALAASIGMNDS